MIHTWFSILFLLLCLSSAQAGAGENRLAKALFEEGDWTACITECRRIEAGDPGHQEAVRLRKRAEEKLHHVSKNGWKQVGAWPIKGLVAFYRVAIASAIGSRCVLEPSCSRYSLEAARKHGLLGIPMTGDRLIREPSVVMEAAQPVADANGKIRYADPVEEHLPSSGW